MKKKVKDFIDKILRKINQYEWAHFTLPRMRYLKYYKKLQLDEKAVLLESQHGTEINGNMFYLIKELRENPKYQDFTVYLTCRTGNRKRFRSVLNKYNLKGVKLLVLYTNAYMKAVTSVKYLFNDNTYLPFFIKKEGQVYINTWHGTPLKTLGRSIKNAMHAIGNAQKNFVTTDYMLYPNKYTMDHMIEDYMYQDIAVGESLLGGYPRNTAFFNKTRGEEIKEELDIKDKKIYAYMPTWRGVVGDLDKKANIYFQYYLFELDERLKDDEIVYLNLHPIAKKNVDFKAFKHIKNFPKKYETYDFLSCADCLITDYSSVFYDFANTRKKIVLFTFDEKDYFSSRGVYRPMSELPFPKVKTIEDLLKEVRSEKNYDDEAFLKEYCSYENANASEALLDFALFGKSNEKLEVVPIPKNGKKNVLIYIGNLDQNGITTSALNLLKSVDTSEYNYYVSFSAEKAKTHQKTIASLPKGVRYFPVMGGMNLGYFKKKFWFAFNKKHFPLSWIMPILKDEWQFEIRRIYGGADFSNAIQFHGYELKMNLLFSQFKCNTAVYVHNDMNEEIKLKKNQRRNVLKYIYKTYDNVALVTEDLFDSTAKFVKNTDNYKIVHNTISFNEIIKRGQCDIAFDNGATKSNRTVDEVKAILDSDAKVIINVGRFSKEKGQKRLIDAFNNVWQKNKNTYLIIIGGLQRDNVYDELKEYITTLPCGENVILILSMTNPLPIVKKCDGFILSSFYEGFGLVIAEADILGLPVVSTDITGPKTFMEKYNGVLVDNSLEGVQKGVELLVDGKVPMLSTDYKEYNKNAVNEFKTMLK